MRSGGGARDLRRAVALGLALALAIIGLAILFRPAPAATANGDDVPNALGSAPIPASAARIPGTPAADIAVRLRVGPGMSDALRVSLRGAIIDAGFSEPEVLAMPFPVERGRVEFFHGADRAAAETVARRLAPLVPAPVDVRDLGETAAVRPGLIEIWIAN